MSTSIEDFVIVILVLANVVWAIIGYPLGYYDGKQQGICETTYSGAKYIDGECLIPAKK